MKFDEIAKGITRGGPGELHLAVMTAVALAKLLSEKGVIKEADLQREIDALDKIATAPAKK